MTRDDQQRLLDILECVNDLAQISKLTLNDFLSNKIAQRAAERLLEIIGEAANSLGEEFKARHGGVEWRQLIALRHLLAHHYHRVDPQQIWIVITAQIPELVYSLGSDVR
ncbi:MAG: DUF86 domain-containing protein [Actinobacteria bacterium]|nr:DUF86 domain-containing protein [Actinomycetota bacterium]